MLADQLDFIVGVDPHRDEHALAVVDVVSGAVVFEATVAASSEAMRTRSGSPRNTRRLDVRSRSKAPALSAPG